MALKAEGNRIQSGKIEGRFLPASRKRTASQCTPRPGYTTSFEALRGNHGSGHRRVQSSISVAMLPFA